MITTITIVSSSDMSMLQVVKFLELYCGKNAVEGYETEAKIPLIP